MVKVKIVKILKNSETKKAFAITYLVAKRGSGYIELYNWTNFSFDEKPQFTITMINKSIYLALNELAYEDGFLV